MTNTSFSGLSAQQLRRAARIKDKIESLQSQLSQIFGESPKAQSSSKPKRKMSAAGRAKISAAAKARWAKVKAAKKK